MSDITPQASPTPAAGSEPGDRPGLEIVRPGPLATIQDLGRPGYADLGVPHSGALDRPALIHANRLAGNPDGAAALEVTFGGLRLRAHVDAVVVLSGAPAGATVDGEPVPAGAAFRLPAGRRLELAAPKHGVRTYVAVSGGFAVPEVLGSRSTDTLSGLGPAPLRPGDVLPVGVPSRPSTAVVDGHDSERTGPFQGRPMHGMPGHEFGLRVTLGPRDDWFADPRRLLRQAYRFQAADRVGARLAGTPLARAADRDGELPSEGMVAGAIQVPADGQPIVFLADHPTTGGYPVVAVVHPDDLPILAQARPGARVIFHEAEREQR